MHINGGEPVSWTNVGQADQVDGRCIYYFGCKKSNLLLLSHFRRYTLLRQSWCVVVINVGGVIFGLNNSFRGYPWFSSLLVSIWCHDHEESVSAASCGNWPLPPPSTRALLIMSLFSKASIRAFIPSLYNGLLNSFSWRQPADYSLSYPPFATSFCRQRLSLSREKLKTGTVYSNKESGTKLETQASLTELQTFHNSFLMFIIQKLVVQLELTVSCLLRSRKTTVQSIGLCPPAYHRHWFH